jgi:hypothetical protein
MKELSIMSEFDGGRIWRNKMGDLHRVGGPAVEHKSGSRKWLINGYRHRLDGPAIEWVGGHKEWWINGEQLSSEEFDCHPLVIFHQMCKETA